MLAKTKLHYFSKIVEPNGINLEIAVKLENLAPKNANIDESQDTIDPKEEKIDEPAAEETTEDNAEQTAHSEPHTPVAPQPTEMEVDKADT